MNIDLVIRDISPDDVHYISTLAALVTNNTESCDDDNAPDEDQLIQVVAFAISQARDWMNNSSHYYGDNNPKARDHCDAYAEILNRFLHEILGR